MKILIVSGHVSGHNTCKTTGVNEGDLNIELAKKVVAKLKKYCTVDFYPYERDMYKDNCNGCMKKNLKNYNYIFEIHFNAFNGKAEGTNIQIHGNYKGGTSVEKAIVDNLARVLGIRERGDKGITRRTDLKNMNTCYRAGIDYALAEICFYDNAAEMNIYKKKKDEVASGIVDGIVKGFKLTKEDTATNYLVRMLKDSAIFASDDGKKEAGKVKKGEAFTIVKESSGYGKLKSGAGWILLTNTKKI